MARRRHLRPQHPGGRRKHGGRRNLDTGRLHKDIGLVLETGSWPKPVITPDDPAAVIAVLTRHGVTVHQ